MMRHDGPGPDDAYEIRHFSCEERAALKAHLIARAHAERSRMLRQCVGAAVKPLALARRGLRHLFIAARTAARFLRARQRRMAELRQLAAMSDLELRDIGISRMEIRAAAQSDSLWPRHGLRVAAPATQTMQGETYAESLLDCPRLGS